MTVKDTEQATGTGTEEATQRDTFGAFFGKLIIAMLFPFMALFYGPSYIAKKQFGYGIAILVIVGVEFVLALNYLNG